MKAKILELMQREGLKPSQLAELLDISPAIISHILSERNKPSLDLLCKILRRFPQINPDWLLLDDPNMYRDVAANGTGTSGNGTNAAGTEMSAGRSGTAGGGMNPTPEANAPGTLRTPGFHGGLFDVAGALSPRHVATGEKPSGDTTGQPIGARSDGANRDFASTPDPGGRSNIVSVARVVICYTDGTCESYLPTR